MKLVSALVVLAVISPYFNPWTAANKTKYKFSAPFLVSITRRDSSGEDDPICTGAIISPARILTAENCLVNNLTDLFIVAGQPFQDYKGEKRKIASYITPHLTNTNDTEQIAVATLSRPLELDGKIVKINVNSEKIDAYSEMLNGTTFRVFQYYYTSDDVVKRVDMIPKDYKENVTLLKKHMYLEFLYRYEDTDCKLEPGSSIGSPVIRDHEVIGVVIRRLTDNKCEIDADAIAVRSSIFVYWIEDQIRKDVILKNSKGGPVDAPFLTSIQRYTPTGKLKHFCSGSLIAPDLVLTAAICLKHGTKELVIVAGITNLTDPVGQRRSIISHEISKSRDPLRQQIAVARVYPPFFIDKNVKSIDVNFDYICGSLSLYHYLYGPEDIDMHIFDLRESQDYSRSYFEMDGDFIVINNDCPFKLFSLTGGAAVFDKELAGVIVYELEDRHCHIFSTKLAVRLSKWKQWLALQMKEKM